MTGNSTVKLPDGEVPGAMPNCLRAAVEFLVWVAKTPADEEADSLLAGSESRVSCILSVFCAAAA
jgi:hypothetical protein